jgi:hypothetical protein
MTMSEWALRWDRGSLVVQSLGAMLLPRFDLPDDRSIAPLATPPWAREPRTPGQPRCVGFMRGEWPCIPFGLAGPSPEVAPRWRPFFSEAAEGPLHGPGSNLHWSLLDRSPRHLSLRVDYPAEHEIAWVERRLSVADGRAAVDCELAVMARRDARLPIGLHPIMRLPRRSGAARLRPGAFKFGITCPYRFEAKGSVAGLDRRFTDLARVPAADGRPFDLSRYPLEGAYEDALQLCGIEGRVDVDNLEEGYTFSVELGSGCLSLLHRLDQQCRPQIGALERPPSGARHRACLLGAGPGEQGEPGRKSPSPGWRAHRRPVSRRRDLAHAIPPGPGALGMRDCVRNSGPGDSAIVGGT